MDYYGRLDKTLNLDLKELKKFLKDKISIHIVGGEHFHPKVIWLHKRGAYIGSANLTKAAWKLSKKNNNIECGLWLEHKELEDNNLIPSLEEFFKFIHEKSKPLLLETDISKFEESKNRISESSMEAKKTSAKIKKEVFGNFSGFSTKSNSSKTPELKKTNPSKKSDLKTTEESFIFWAELKSELEAKKEMLGLEVSKPYYPYARIEIKLEPIGYIGHIKAYKSFEHHLGVYYGFKNKDKVLYDELKEGRMSHLLKEGHFETIDKTGWNSYSMAFWSSKDEGTTEKEYKQWIIDQIIKLLAALRSE